MISIIIPVYNQEKHLSKCLDSLLYQTFKEIEVILVDDASKDKSVKIAESYIDKFKKADIRYEIVKKEINKGAPAARNRGFQSSKGDYVFFCDSDSVLDKNALLYMLSELIKYPKTSFAYSSFYWGKKLFRLGNFSYEKLRKMPYIHTMSLIRVKDYPITGWDENIKKLQDWDLWLTMAERGKTGAWIDKTLFMVNTGGTISSWLPSIFYKILPFLPQVKKYNEAAKIVKTKHHLL